jgi:hypothetical protein
VKGLKSTLTMAIAIGLLAGSAVGVTAQDEENAAAAFTMEVTGTPDSSDYDETTKVSSTINMGVEATDARASGLLSWTGFYGDVGSAEELPWFGVRKFGVRLDNDDGAWTGTRDVFFATEPDERTKKQKRQKKGKTPLDFGTDFIELTGEGGYEGLTMLMTNREGGFVGIIVPSDWVPAQPDPPLAAPPAE